MAFQLAFDLVNNATQQFLSTVLTSLPQDEAPSDLPPLETVGESMDVDKADDYASKLKKLKTVLGGETTINLYLDFLFR